MLASRYLHFVDPVHLSRRWDDKWRSGITWCEWMDESTSHTTLGFDRTRSSLSVLHWSDYRTEVNMETLKGRTALVTGASRGLGAAIALELGARGAKVAVN